MTRPTTEADYNPLTREFNQATAWMPEEKKRQMLFADKGRELTQSISQPNIGQQQRDAAKMQNIDLNSGLRTYIRWNPVLQSWGFTGGPQGSTKITQQEYEELMDKYGSIPFAYNVVPTIREDEVDKYRKTYGASSLANQVGVLKEGQTGLIPTWMRRSFEEMYGY